MYRKLGMFFFFFLPRFIVKCCGFRFRRVKFLRLGYSPFLYYFHSHSKGNILFENNLFISGLKILVYKRRDLFDAEDRR